MMKFRLIVNAALIFVSTLVYYSVVLIENMQFEIDNHIALAETGRIMLVPDGGFPFGFLVPLPFVAFLFLIVNRKLTVAAGGKVRYLSLVPLSLLAAFVSYLALWIGFLSWWTLT